MSIVICRKYKPLYAYSLLSCGSFMQGCFAASKNGQNWPTVLHFSLWHRRNSITEIPKLYYSKFILVLPEFVNLFQSDSICLVKLMIKPVFVRKTSLLEDYFDKEEINNCEVRNRNHMKCKFWLQSWKMKILQRHSAFKIITDL